MEKFPKANVLILQLLDNMPTSVSIWVCDSLLFGLSKERPILGDYPKAHKTLYEKCCAFREKHLKSEKQH